MIVKHVTCPTCKGAALYDSSNESRPFCSSRCQLGDLATWAADGYRIPVVTAPQIVSSTGNQADAVDLDDISFHGDFFAQN
jgi:endogenous inhibitor of DNA gyrase (YacG/DUF329 family)